MEIIYNSIIFSVRLIAICFLTLDAQCISC